jgi:tRNA(fMet)-specific endonuclease VapC
MSLHVLDTDMLQLFQDENPLVAERVHATAPGDLAISVVTVEEQLSGWYTQLRKAKRPERLAWAYRRLAATVRFLNRIQIVDFDESAIRRCEQLKKRKLKVGTMDLRIAATVLEQDAILVTRNAHDFHRVPDLRIEDWSKEASSN